MDNQVILLLLILYSPELQNSVGII